MNFSWNEKESKQRAAWGAGGFNYSQQLNCAQSNFEKYFLLE
jgi:hypothetical protein